MTHTGMPLFTHSNNNDDNNYNNDDDDDDDNNNNNNNNKLKFFLARDELGTCKTSLVSPEQPALCIPARPTNTTVLTIIHSL